jgi:hypothetical protein
MVVWLIGLLVDWLIEAARWLSGAETTFHFLGLIKILNGLVYQVLNPFL